jgi:hypothetical protein
MIDVLLQDSFLSNYDDFHLHGAGVLSYLLRTLVRRNHMNGFAF